MKGHGAGITSGYRFGVFVNVVVICCLGLLLMGGLVFMVKELSFSTDLRWDVTREGRYELDPLARSLLAEVRSPVQVTFVAGIDRNIGNRVLDAGGRMRGDLLDGYYLPLLNELVQRVERVAIEWQKVSAHVTQHVLLQTREPARAQDLAAQQGITVEGLINKVVIGMAGRRREVPIDRLADIDWGRFDPYRRMPDRPPVVRSSWRVQAELTNALRAVLHGESTTIGVPAGMNAVLEPGSGPARPAESVLIGQGYSVLPLKLATLSGIPEHVDILLLPAVGTRIEARQMRLVVDFERRGGRILLVADPGRPENFERLLESYGIQLSDVLVTDASNAERPTEAPHILRSNALCNPSSVIAGPLQRRFPILLGPSRAIVVGPDRATGTRVTTTLQASEDSRVVPMEFPQGGRRPVAARGRERAAPRCVLAVEASRPVDVEGHEARVVVIAGAGVLAGNTLRDLNLANRDLLLNSLAWLADRPASIAINPRDDYIVRVDPVSRAFEPVFWICVLTLPGLAFLAALLCVFLRGK